MTRRLSLAVDTGHVVLPVGRLLVLGAGIDSDLAPLDPSSAVLEARYRDTMTALQEQGWSFEADAGDASGAIVFLPRARRAQRALVRLARAATAGPIIVDGAKTDGVDAFWRELRSRADVSAAYSKSHGKVFTVAGGSFEDWPEHAPYKGPDGWWRAPGVFSADAVDKASARLATALPTALPGRVADFGAGWGYLSDAILKREGVTALHLVENDRLALAAAARNIADTRAVFHWEDVLSWQPPERLDHVVTNPPFHAGRKGVPELGQAFIRRAAELLSPKGSLWLVANRHLPYEATLSHAFREVREAGDDKAFKVLHATRPRSG